MPADTPSKPPVNVQAMANNAAAIQYALMVLGHCLIARHSDGTYVLHGIKGGIHVVAEEGEGLYCISCDSRFDLHVAIITIYQVRWEDY